eukprot:CAMPEP_0198732058 /NCGR_PEP_ID=MMETSP1475-20131203/33615_1 /TAXON_ID= ORGANISM="Unidentified sp., Strain CCMP1999" /NCGR_SAMPLE_ID=MMETSP1475 /ASSEMBLY_ACC=CAM_ASM_001111 /LENGTH=90 /DNA_ID=CAMNT_0044495097 /DNA_START=109 /DNA_END=378 /DNA_ORIENTATION=-
MAFVGAGVVGRSSRMQAATFERRQVCVCMDLGRREFTELLLFGAAGDIRSGISKAASFLPGLGASDVYYPESFGGEWVVERTVADVKVGT